MSAERQQSSHEICLRHQSAEDRTARLEVLVERINQNVAVLNNRVTWMSGFMAGMTLISTALVGAATFVLRYGDKLAGWLAH